MSLPVSCKSEHINTSGGRLILNFLFASRKAQFDVWLNVTTINTQIVMASPYLSLIVCSSTNFYFPFFGYQELDFQHQFKTQSQTCWERFWFLRNTEFEIFGGFLRTKLKSKHHSNNDYIFLFWLSFYSGAVNVRYSRNM